MKPPKVKMFDSFPTTVRVWETDDDTRIRVVVSIATGKGKHVEYAQVKVKALDDRGVELKPLERKAAASHLMDAMGTQTGFFEFGIAKKQIMGFVEVQFAGQKETFEVEEILKPVPGPK